MLTHSRNYKYFMYMILFFQELQRRGKQCLCTSIWCLVGEVIHTHKLTGEWKYIYIIDQSWGKMSFHEYRISNWLLGEDLVGEVKTPPPRMLAWTSLAVHRGRLCTSTVAGTGLIPGGGAKILHATQQKKKKRLAQGYGFCPFCSLQII